MQGEKGGNNTDTTDVNDQADNTDTTAPEQRETETGNTGSFEATAQEGKINEEDGSKEREAAGKESPESEEMDTLELVNELKKIENCDSYGRPRNSDGPSRQPKSKSKYLGIKSINTRSKTKI